MSGTARTSGPAPSRTPAACMLGSTRTTRSSAHEQSHVQTLARHGLSCCASLSQRARARPRMGAARARCAGSVAADPSAAGCMAGAAVCASAGMGWILGRLGQGRRERTVQVPVRGVCVIGRGRGRGRPLQLRELVAASRRRVLRSPLAGLLPARSDPPQRACARLCGSRASQPAAAHAPRTAPAGAAAVRGCRAGSAVPGCSRRAHRPQPDDVGTGLRGRPQALELQGALI